MNNQIDKNELFYDRYLGEPDRRTPAIVTGLGLASFRIINEKLLDRIKEVAKLEEIEGEFAFVRNTHLHFKPSYHNGAVSSGILTFHGRNTAGVSKISQYAVNASQGDHQYSVMSLSDVSNFATIGYKPSGPVKLNILAGIIAYSFT